MDTLRSLPTVLGNRSIKDPKQSPLWGLRAIFIGDSICHNKYEQLKDPSTAGWPGRIGTKYEMQWCNLGIGGATVSVIHSNNTTAQLKSAIEQNTPADLLLLQGGINDAYNGVAPGEIEEGFAPDSFSQTYAGCLQNLFALSRRHYPKARLFYIIHHTTPNALRLDDMSKPNIPKGDPAVYVELTRKICQKWDVPYLDLFGDDTFNNEIFDTTNNSTGCMWPDRLHLGSPKGYDTLTAYIVAWLEHCYTV